MLENSYISRIVEDLKAAWSEDQIRGLEALAASYDMTLIEYIADIMD
jgi:hypothetical protein